MAKRPTIIDVAREAGVSKSTVSLVLQDSQTVRDETRAKVRAAMRKTGYVYNRGAAHMRGGSTGLIGLVINNLRNPFYTEFAVSTQMTLTDQGFATVVANSNNDWRLQEQVVGSMLEHGVDGLIIAPCYGGDRQDFDRIARAGLPTIQVLRHMDERTDVFPFCSMQYDTGSYAATNHLITRGERRIAYVGGDPDYSITHERIIGYDKRMQEEGLETTFVLGESTREFGAEAARRLMADHPDVTAALTFNDLVALGMMPVFAEAGRQVGRDFHLIGFDDIAEAAQVWPRLSTVRCDVKQFGITVSEMLLTWLQTGTKPAGCTRFPTKLITRETG